MKTLCVGIFLLAVCTTQSSAGFDSTACSGPKEKAKLKQVMAEITKIQAERDRANALLGGAKTGRCGESDFKEASTKAVLQHAESTHQLQVDLRNVLNQKKAFKRECRNELQAYSVSTEKELRNLYEKLEVLCKN